MNEENEMKKFESPLRYHVREVIGDIILAKSLTLKEAENLRDEVNKDTIQFFGSLKSIRYGIVPV